MIERMVLFGASGDLTSRLLMPAVAQLAEAELLPRPFTIVGSATRDWSSEEFRQHIAGALKEHSTVKPATRDAVVRMLSFQPADVTQPKDVRGLIGDDHPDTLAYLALPPGLLTSVLPALATCKRRRRGSDREALRHRPGLGTPPQRDPSHSAARADNLSDRSLPVQRACSPCHRPSVP